MRGLPLARRIPPARALRTPPLGYGAKGGQSQLPRRAASTSTLTQHRGIFGMRRCSRRPRAGSPLLFEQPQAAVPRATPRDLTGNSGPTDNPAEAPCDPCTRSGISVPVGMRPSHFRDSESHASAAQQAISQDQNGRCDGPQPASLVLRFCGMRVSRTYAWGSRRSRAST